MEILRPLPEYYEVNYRDCFRLLAAISGFKRQFGRWPTRLKVNPDLFSYVAQEILTPESIEILKQKIEIEFVIDLNDVLAEDSQGAVWSYGDNPIPESVEDTEKWIFGHPIDQGSR